MYILLTGPKPEFGVDDIEPLPITSTHPLCTDQKNEIEGELDDSLSSLDLTLINTLECEHVHKKPYLAADTNDTKREWSQLFVFTFLLRLLSTNY